MKKNIFLLPFLTILFGFLTACAQSAHDSPESEPTPTTVPPAATEVNTMEKRFLALGDSYTIGESVAESERWPVQLVSMLNDSNIPFSAPQIIAKTGWTTAELESALQGQTIDPPYDLVSLLIGVNNQYRGYAQEEYRVEFAGLLQTAIAFAGDRPDHVIVLSIPDWGATPFAERDPRGPETIKEQIAAFNAINQEESLRAGVQYVDIFPLSQRAYDDKGLIAGDNLHPSAAQYTLWAIAALPVVIQIFR